MSNFEQDTKEQWFPNMAETLLTKSQGEKCQYLVCFSLLHVSSQFPIRLTEHRIDVPNRERRQMLFP
jgi:hypothetical protein